MPAVYADPEIGHCKDFQTDLQVVIAREHQKPKEEYSVLPDKNSVPISC